MGHSVRASLVILLLAGVLAGAVYAVVLSAPAGERAIGASLHLFGAQDFVWLILSAMICLLAIYLSRATLPIPALRDRPVVVVAMSIAVVVVVRAGVSVVYHAAAISMDEFMMLWQSRAIQAGSLLVRAPEAWWPYASALRPGFLIVDPVYQVWAPPYRPGTSLLHAVFARLSLDAAMNAIFCGGSVLVLWRLARQTLPPGTGAVMCAVLLFALSPQFLITGMTPYTMTAHLFASLLWVWLFTLDRGWSHSLAIVLGCYALGLHHVHVHGGLALPFLLHLAFVRRRWWLALAYGAAYSIATVVWVFWMDIAVWMSGLSPIPAAAPAEIDGGLDLIRAAAEQGAASHGWQDLALWGVNISRLIAWQNLAVLPLLLVAMGRFRAMPVTLRLMGWSVLTSLLPYLLLMPSQGHGWGYRYLHHELGTLALLAGFGWAVLKEGGRTRDLRFVVVVAGVSAIVGLPLRAVQTERFVRPIQTATVETGLQDAEVVLLATEGLWYGRDLVRNDPLVRNRPVVMAIEMIPDRDLALLCAGRRVVLMDESRFMETGIALKSEPDASRSQRRDEVRARFARAGCGS